jgi:hypothetical protein
MALIRSPDLARANPLDEAPGYAGGFMQMLHMLYLSLPEMMQLAQL